MSEETTEEVKTTVPTETQPVDLPKVDEETEVEQEAEEPKAE